MVLRNNEATEKLKKGINLLADTVGATLGPKGRNVILFGDADKPYLTKDGISVAKNIYDEDPAINAGITILREASEKTAKEAGDGTTTSIILAREFYNAGLNMLETGSSIIDVKKKFNEILDIVKKHIELVSHKMTFTKEMISFIATTSANNDTAIGNLVADAYLEAGENGTVKAVIGNSSNTYIEMNEGSYFKLGLVSKDFFNSDKKSEASYDECFVLLYNNSVKHINDIMPGLAKAAEKKLPIVVFADNFSQLSLQQMWQNHIKGVVRIIPISVTGYSGHKKDLFGDLSALTGATVYESLKMGSKECNLGFCKKIVATIVDTVILNDESDDYKRRVVHLNNLIDSEKNDVLKEVLVQRLNSLKGNIANIYVGGITDVEAKERFDRIDDAICAVKASLEEGVCDGGGYTLLTAPESVRYILSAPFKQLCENCGYNSNDLMKKIFDNLNGFNFLTDKFENLYESGVIDPVKVVRLSVENAVSVAIALLTTSAIVY